MSHVGNRGFVSILLGNGDGSFQAPNNMPVPDDLGIIGGAYGILARDFDGDGKLDLVVAVGEQRRVLFFKGHGDSAFSNPVGFSAVDHCVGVQTTDLNGDGFLDLVTTNSGDHSVSVLFGNGNGTFQAATTYATNFNPQAVALANVDGLNRDDIIVGCYGDGNNQPSIDVLLNNGNGTFPSVATRFNQQVQVLGLYAADFDGDNKIDVVATGFGGPTSRSLVLIKGAGNGAFFAPPDQNFQAIEDTPLGSTRFSENIPVDLNGDGFPDLLIDHGVSLNLVTVALGQGDGHFAIQELVASNGPGFSKTSAGNPPTADGNGTSSTIAGDFNGDGLPDLAVACSQHDVAGGVSLIVGTGPGRFHTPRGIPLMSGSGFFYIASNERSTALGDFNGDNKLDFITLENGGNPEHIAEVSLGNGDSTFGAPFAALPGTSGLGTGVSALRVADMNNDGKLDVIVTSGPAGVQGNQGTTATRIAYGQGNGTFTYAASLLPGDPNWAIPNVVVADFNHDGHLDVAVVTSRFGDFRGSESHIDVFLQSSSQDRVFTRTATYHRRILD